MNLVDTVACIGAVCSLSSWTTSIWYCGTCWCKAFHWWIWPV